MINPMMTRILTISCILLAVATFAVMTVDSAVKVHSSTAQLVNPGDEFMVKVSIDKGVLKKGAVLQQAIPEGFSVSAIENEGAQFYFENQMVRFVWENMPAKPVLVIAYKMKAEETVQGIKKLNGSFIYAQGNKTAQINIPENIIYVSNDFPVSNAEHLDENAGTLLMQRSISEGKGESANGYRITLNVKNENESGFASWTEQIPSGYTIEVNAANNAAFSTDGSLIKFNWTEMPSEKFWSFTYTLFSVQDKIPTEKPELLGIMVYGSSESIKTCIPGNSPFSNSTFALITAQGSY